MTTLHCYCGGNANCPRCEGEGSFDIPDFAEDSPMTRSIRALNPKPVSNWQVLWTDWRGQKHREDCATYEFARAFADSLGVANEIRETQKSND